MPLKVSIIDNNPGVVLRTALPKDIKELADIVVTEPWAPAMFSTERRTAATASQTEIIALDVDDGCTLATAKEIFLGYKHIIATSRNHQKAKNGVVADRFRVVLFLSKAITDSSQFKATFYEIKSEYPFVDSACSDISRFFFPCVEIISVNESGKLIKPSQQLSCTNHSSSQSTAVEPALLPSERGRLSYSTICFLRGIGEAGKPGRWNHDLYKAAKDFQEQRYPKEVAIRFFEAMTNGNYNGTLDESDLKTIESAYAVEPKYQPRIKGEF